MINIQSKLTPYNFTKMGSTSRIKYIVVHYTGSAGTAKNNASYFASNKLSSSAHYFVDENSIWQCVRDEDKSWHCGGGLQGKSYHAFYNKCTNSNSIGIEMCCKNNGNWYFEPNTVSNTADLVAMLCKKYNVPLSNVIRHADVTGKQCPAPYCYSSAGDKAWEEFKKRVGAKMYDVSVKDCTLVGKVKDCTSLNVRSCPSTSGNVIAKLANGDTVWINGKCDNGWYRADFKGSIGVGYFSGNYIQIVSEEKQINDTTVANMVADGITTTDNVDYWERVLNGKEEVNISFVRSLLDRYHNKIK